jgi:DNA replication protein DnaC
MSAPVLADLCQRLQLGEVGRLAESRAEQAAAAQQAYPAYLTDLLQTEADARPQRYITSRTQMAPLPYHKTLDPCDFGFQPSLDARPVRELAPLQGVDAAANLVALGPPGVGKTHWVVALALAAIPARHSVYFITSQDLVADLRKAWHENRFPARLALYTRPKLLGMDEVGYLALDRLEANLFFRVISARYETGSLALTSNKGFSEWGEVFGDPVLATAILDRLLHHATILNIRGESYRLKDKKRAGTWGPRPTPAGEPHAGL